MFLVAKAVGGIFFSFEYAVLGYEPICRIFFRTFSLQPFDFIVCSVHFTAHFLVCRNRNENVEG